jgi:hypothetical protein
MDIRRDALAQSFDAEQTQHLLEGLVRAGWLRRKETIQTGGRPLYRWQVNPLLFSTRDAESAESAETYKEND